MMEYYLAQWTHWYWWIAALVLLVLELLLPSTFFLWLGVAAAAVGTCLWFIPELSWEWQWSGFAIFSVAAIVIWRVRLSHKPTPTDQPSLNRRGEQYIGREFTLEQPIENGRGKIRVDDTSWKISGDDMPIGTTVVVVSIDGVIFRVERV